MDQPLHAEDERLPAVRARLFLLVRSLWREGILQVPLTVEADGVPALQLLHPLWRQLRAELLGMRLLRDIIPAIERQMSGKGTLHREESHLRPSGPVDWPTTWRRMPEQRAERPLVIRRWERELELPENRLAWEALQRVVVESQRVMHTSFSVQHQAILQALLKETHRRLDRPPWRDFQPSTSRPRVEEARARIDKLPHRPAYAALLSWWRQWHSCSQPAGGDQPLLDPNLEADWLFELLLLFELVAALAGRLPMRQCRALAGDSSEPLFVGYSRAGELLIYYQSGMMFSKHRSLVEIAGIPDIVIQLPGEVPTYVILDAKNYRASGHTQAIYKMLGYLYQFGYNPRGVHHFERILAGILVFPTNEREGFGLRQWQEEQPKAQSVMSFVLPPLPDGRFNGLNRLVDWLVTKIENG